MLKTRSQKRVDTTRGDIERGTDDSKYGGKRRVFQGPLPWLLLACFGVFAVTTMFQFARLHSEAEQAEDAITIEPHNFNVPPEVLDQVDGAQLSLEEDERIKSQESLVEIVDEIPVGYVRVPKIPAGPRTSDDGKLHIVFSSGCNWFQHWQSELLMATAHFVGQRGRVTRIVSGCHDKAAETVQHSHQTFPSGKNDLLVPVKYLNRSVNPDFGLYITPSFEGAIDFPWINKPSSIDYFMRHARSEIDRLGETVIAILDPDFIFMKPLSQRGSLPEDILKTRGTDGFENDPMDVVKKGRPVAQRYGLEGHWIKRFPVAEITKDPNSPALRYSAHDAAKYFSVGPPLLLHVDDLTDLAALWQDYMRPVLKIDSDILADMWAYSIAAAHLDLKHTILDQYMISTWGSRGQAYPWVDAWETMSCLNPQPKEGYKTPNFIHLASNFKAPESQEWMFHKGHVPADILACDSPLIVESPDNIFDISPHDKDHRNQRAWILCHTVARLNKMLLAYKEKFCPKGYEQRKLVRLIQKKTRDRTCSQRRDKWCYPLAQIEGLPDNWRDSA